MSGDGLRDELVKAMIEPVEAMTGFPIEKRQIEELGDLADAVLPVVQARIDAAREQVAEQALERERQLDSRWQERWREECDRAEAAEQAVQRAREVHQKRAFTKYEYCVECDVDERAAPWPCDTIRALDGTP